MSKAKTSKTDYPAPQQLLDADFALRVAADKFGDDENDETMDALRAAAVAFADAWHACGAERK